MSKREQVLAVRAGSINLASGFTASANTFDNLFLPETVAIGSRAWLETDEDFLQIIPYVVVVSASGKVLAYARTGGDSRLLNNVSVGIGGHINVADLVISGDIIDVGETIQVSARREINEELEFPRPDYDRPYTIEFKGFIWNPDNSVGRVHLGVLMACRLSGSVDEVKNQITSDDEGIKLLGFFDPEYLLSGEDDIELEGWSDIALKSMGGWNV